MIALALFAAAALGPGPQPLKLFRDWTVGCDNGLYCHAVALMPEDMADGAITMAVERGPEAGAAPQIDFSFGGSGARTLLADGRPVAARLLATADGARVAPADVPAVIAALRSAVRLELRDGKGASLGIVSLAGASAALLYMDDRQHRVGTVTALARPGTQPASAVPAPPPLPVVRAAPIGRNKPLAIGAARLKAVRRDVKCELEDVGGPDEAETYALDARRTLVLLSCGAGAYNLTSVPLIAENDGRGIRIVVAPFDRRPEWWKDDPPMVVNAGFTPSASLLSSFSKGRGLGDCGGAEDYVWDGQLFRLVEQKEMGECRGSTDFITVWRAKVIQP